jgi:hypothetical protein
VSNVQPVISWQEQVTRMMKPSLVPDYHTELDFDGARSLK